MKTKTKVRANIHYPGPAKGFTAQIMKLYAHREIYLMMIPGLAFFVIFSYIPMYGITIAFKNFNFAQGLLRSPWIGFDNFISFFKSESFYTLTRNTLLINIYKIVWLFPISIFTAIALDQIKNRILRRTIQSITFLPYFISWIMIESMLYGFVNPTSGTLTMLAKNIGMDMPNIYGMPELWRSIITATYVWQIGGYYSIIFFAAISGIEQELYEAAIMDGASKFRQIWHVTLPCIKPTAIVLLILQIGYIMNGNFGQVFALVGNNSAVYSTVDVLDTFVYRGAFVKGDFSYPAAVGLYQSVVSMLFVIVTNYVVKKRGYEGIF